MRIHYRIKGLGPAAELKKRAERSLYYALGRFLGSVTKVYVTLEDVNGPRGGVDALCKLRLVTQAGGEPVLAEALERDGQTAIDKAAARLGRSLARRSSVRRDRRRVTEV